MNLKSIAIALGMGVVVMSCEQNRMVTTDTGLKYQILDQSKDARKIKEGDVLSFHLVLKNSEDSTLNDTYKSKNPIRMMYQKPEFKGSFEEGLGLLSVGDSAVFFVNADSLFAKMQQPLPPIIKPGSDLEFRVRILNAQTPEEFQSGRQEEMEKQKSVDEETIKKFLAEKNLTDKATRSASGLYYVKQQAGNGNKPAANDKVSVHYEGRLLDGTVFDGSKSNPMAGGKPIEFNVGAGMVIPGWDEGILNMEKGEKGMLIIPSGLAYGPDGSPGAIPGNSVLVFDVELVDFKK